MSYYEKKPFAVELSRRLRRVMIDTEISSADIMRNSKLGTGQISTYLNGYTIMKADTLKELCAVLGCSADYLLGLSEHMYNPMCPASCKFVKTRKEKNNESI